MASYADATRWVFANVVTPNTDSTNKFLLSSGMSILTEDMSDTGTMNFVRPLLLHGIATDDDVVFSVPDMNGNTVTLNSSDLVPLMPVTSLAVLNGAIDKMEYYYEACPDTKLRVEDKSADTEAELNEMQDVMFGTAAVPCLVCIDTNAELKTRTVPIDQPVEC